MQQTQLEEGAAAQQRRSTASVCSIRARLTPSANVRLSLPGARSTLIVSTAIARMRSRCSASSCPEIVQAPVG